MSENVTLRQRQAIAALLTDGDVSKAATAAGVSRQTMYRWQRDGAFVAALRAAEGDAWRGLARRMAGLGDAAANALRDALAEDQPIAVRLRAVALLTERGPALLEMVDLEARIAALEAAVERDT